LDTLRKPFQSNYSTQPTTLLNWIELDIRRLNASSFHSHHLSRILHIKSSFDSYKCCF